MSDSNEKLPLLCAVARQYANARQDFRSFLDVAVSYNYSVPDHYDALKDIWEEAVEQRSNKIIPLS